MKIRYSFVANSSSSNFVLVGVIVPKDEFDFEALIGFNGFDLYNTIERFIRRTGLYVSNNMGSGSPSSDSVMIGRMVRSNMDEYCLPKIHELSIVEETRAKLLELGITAPIKLITGSIEN